MIIPHLYILTSMLLSVLLTCLLKSLCCACTKISKALFVLQDSTGPETWKAIDSEFMRTCMCLNLWMRVSRAKYTILYFFFVCV